MEEGTDNQTENSKPWLWKKGQSGNILGRPKGKTMKEWAREYLSKMTDEERDDFMQGIPKEIIWKMSEGNPEATVEAKGGLDLTFKWADDSDNNNTVQA